MRACIGCTHSRPKTGIRDMGYLVCSNPDAWVKTNVPPDLVWGVQECVQNECGNLRGVNDPCGVEGKYWSPISTTRRFFRKAWFG